MKKQNGIKLVSLLSAVTVVTTTLAGCGLFERSSEANSSDTQQAQNDIILDIPKPNEYDLDEELEDDAEQTAEQDTETAKAEDDSKQNKVEEVKPEKEPSSAQTTDRFVNTIDFNTVFETQKQNKVTTSALAPESSSHPEQYKNAVYEPVGETPAPPKFVEVLAKPTAALPAPSTKVKYKNALFQEPGLYTEQKTYKNGTIVAGNATITNKVFTGDLTIDVSKGSVTLKNVKINGSLILKGGSDWVKLYDVTAQQLLVDSKDRSKVFVSRSSGLNGVLVKSDVLLEEGGLYTSARGVSNVVVNAPRGTKVNLHNLRLNQITTKTACDVVNDSSSIINHVYAEAPTELYGSGQINRLYCESNGVYYDTKPLYIETARGYAPPSRRSSSGGSNSGNTQDKKVTLHTIPDQYLDIGSVRYVGIDHNGSSLRVTTTNSSIAKVTYSTSKSRITMKGLKPGTATIKITSSRSGYRSSTISFKLTVKGSSSQNSIQLSPIRDQAMDVDTFRYVTVNTDASRIEVSNSNSSVLQVGTNGFQLSLYAKRAGYSDVKVTAYRSGRPTKSTTFRVNVYEPHHQDSVTIQRIDDQIMNKGDSRYINIRTDAASISAKSSNDKIARVTTYRDNTIRVDSIAPGTAWISVTGSKSGMQNGIEVFRVDVNSDRISAPYVSVHYANGVPYQHATWSNQDIIFDLSGYTSNRTAYSYERPFGTSSNDWGNRRELPKGTLTVKEEGQKDYYFFTKDNNTVSEASKIYTVWIDKTLPSLTVNSNTDTTLNFTVSDARSGVAQVTVTNQDTKEVFNILPTTNGVCSFNASKQGRYSITVMDQAGNRVSSSSYTLNGPTAPDTQKPEITVVNEAQFANWFAKGQEVVFKVSDNSGAVASVNVTPSVVLTRKEDGSYVFSANYEGEQTYTITASDESGNKQTKEIKVKVDKTAPNVEDIAVSPIAGTDTQKVTFRVTEIGSGIKEVNVSPVTNPNAKQVVSKEEKGYSFIGSNNTSYHITVTDNAGNVSLPKEITLKSETPTPPPAPSESEVKIDGVSVENPSDITRSKNIKVTVSAKLTDKQSLTVNLIAPNKVLARPANTTLAVANTYLFTAEENGNYQVEAIIREGDRVIKTSTSAVTVSNIDNKAPVILVSKNENSVVSFTVNDEHLKSVTFDGVVIAAVNGVYTKDNLNAGEHLIYAVDTAGNEASQKVKVVRTPSVNVQNSNLQSTNNKDAATTVRVDTYGEKIVSAQVDQSSATLTKETDNNYRFTATKNGTYRLTFTTESGVSAQAEVSVNGIYATEYPPVITVGKQEINDTHTEVKIPIKVSDDHTAPAAISVKVNNGKLSLGQADGEYFLTMTENGSVTVTAKDDKGNSSETIITVDSITGNIVPVIRLESITADSKTATVTLDISNNGGTEIVSVLDQQGHAAVAAANGKYLLTVSENGHYTVTTKNKAGKAATVDFDVNQIDRTAPVMEAPVVTINETLSQAVVSVQVNDDVNGVKGSGVMQVSLKGTPMQQTASGWQGTITENGTFEVVAQDKAGNAATASVTVSTLDKTAPEIVVTSKNDKWAKEQLVTFSVTDGSSGVESVTVAKGTTAVAVKEENGWKFTAAENGTYVITAKDRAGNQKTQNVVVTKVDKTAPAAPTLKDKTTLIPANNAKTPYELKAKQVAVQFAKAKDGEAPVRLMIKKADAKTFTAFDKTTIDLKEGENKLQLKTVDDAGNESAVTSWVIKVTNSASTASAKPQTTEKPLEPTVKPTEEKVPDTKPTDKEKAEDPVPTEK